jgi:site-specific recombinase XerD
MKRPRLSRLASDIEAFLHFKRSRGCKYERAEFWLKAFARFVEQRSADAAPMDVLARAWLARNGSRKAVSVAYELGVLRQFFEFLRRRDPSVVVPARSWAPQSSLSEFLPHILETKDIKTLLRLAEGLRAPRFYGAMYRMLLLVLYCTGVRFGEAVRLKMRDLDVRRRALWIAESKGRSRWVPFHASLARELARYVVARRAYAAAGPDDALFVGINGKPLRRKTASQIVTVLLRRAHLKPARGRVGPRPYDIRHTFAVHRLTRWYGAGVDVHTRLPWLSAYMGHDNILGTETYLTATPQLLQLAARRLHTRLSQRRRWA